MYLDYVYYGTIEYRCTYYVYVIHAVADATPGMPSQLRVHTLFPASWLYLELPTAFLVSPCILVPISMIYSDSQMHIFLLFWYHKTNVDTPSQ